MFCLVADEFHDGADEEGGEERADERVSFCYVGKASELKAKNRKDSNLIRIQ